MLIVTRMLALSPDGQALTTHDWIKRQPRSKWCEICGRYVVKFHNHYKAGKGDKVAYPNID